MGVATARAKKRRQSCSFTRSTLLNGHNDAVSCVVSLGDWLISGSWDSSIKVMSELAAIVCIVAYTVIPYLLGVGDRYVDMCAYVVRPHWFDSRPLRVQ